MLNISHIQELPTPQPPAESPHAALPSTWRGSSSKRPSLLQRRNVAPVHSMKKSQLSLSKQAPSVSAATTDGGTRSSSWSARDDDTLIHARAQGLNWNQIAPKHFPSKSPNACRKRHERLMERQNAEQFDRAKLDVLAQAYMEVRREMWSILAARVGEKWTLVEQKCMEKGLSNLHQAYRSAQKKQGFDDGNHDDSGIGISDLDEAHDHLPLGLPAHHKYAFVQKFSADQHIQRVPSIHSILHQPMPQQPMAQSTTESNHFRNSKSGNMSISPSPSDNDDIDSPKHEEESASLSTELHSQKDLIVDRLMVHFYDIFDSIDFSYRQRKGTSETPSSRSRQSALNSTSSQEKTKRKFSEGQDSDEDDEAADRSGKKRRKESSSECVSQKEPKKRSFACPYFKHNPKKYREHRSCRGPLGWDAISRLKEHLYRQHTLSPQCIRCCETFKDESQLKAHQRSSDACTVRDHEPLEGLDKRQIEQLKNRKSMFRAGSEEEKWKIIYLIIFPDTSLNGLPSPYYEDEATIDENNRHSPKPPELAQYEAYMNRELPRKVRKELEIAIEKLTGPIEETLKNQLENLIRNCQERLSREFLQSRFTATEKPQQPSMVEGSVNQISTADECSTQAAIIGPITNLQSAEASSSEAVAKCTIPPQSPINAWPFPWDLSGPNYTALSDSGYLSNPSAALPSDPWWVPPEAGSLRHADTMSELDETQRPVNVGMEPLGSGKGKERANCNAGIMEWNSLTFT